jgi:very-short-patch-repair endonuclease
MPTGVYAHTEEHNRKTAEAVRARAVVMKGIPRPEMRRSHVNCACHSVEANERRAASHRGLKWTDETKARISMNLRGSQKALAYHESRRGVPRPPRSEEWKAHISEGMLRSEKVKAFSERRKGVPRTEREQMQCRLAWAIGRDKKGPTCLERALERFLTDVGLEFEGQVPRGVYHVDAYVSKFALVFEADGAYWHRNPRREAARDTYLVRGGAAAVIHLTEQDLALYIVR